MNVEKLPAKILFPRRALFFINLLFFTLSEPLPHFIAPPQLLGAELPIKIHSSIE